MKRGSIMLIALVFGSIFFMILAASIQFIILENRAQDALIAKAESFSIAEAGLQYYGWFLSHFPTDFQNGTGVNGPYVINYTDPESGTAGTYTLSIEGLSACGSTQTVQITSEGVSTAHPSTRSIIAANYASPSVNQYSLITSSNPPSGVVFNDIAPAFGDLKTKAQASGVYIPQHLVPQSPHFGYRLVLNGDGTVTVSLVDGITTLSVKSAETKKLANDYTLINHETPYQTYTINSDCGLIFAEDNVWLEGTAKGKITVVAANLSGSGSAADIVINGNILYSTLDGSDTLSVLSEHNVLIAPTSPINMTLRGTYVAASGIFGRNEYVGAASNCLYENRDTLDIIGTVVSKLTPVTAWTSLCASGKHGGYQTTNMSVDAGAAVDPPPFTPTVSAAKTFLNWYQVQ